MKPVITIVGRANVGKSTLFNRLTKSRDALVADIPGVTRDRQYGEGHIGKIPFIVIDTGGYEPVAKTGLISEMAKQTYQAIIESDILLFVVDAKGMNEHDREIASYLRKLGKKIYLVINKSEGKSYEQSVLDFVELGFYDLYSISASHGTGVKQLIKDVLEPFEFAYKEHQEQQYRDECDDEDSDNEHDEGNASSKNSLNLKAPHKLKIALVGRPNVGKSTFINNVLGEERVIAFDMPGTTRDTIYIDFERNEKMYTFIDTAGIRKRGKIFETIEKFSVVKTLQAISDAHVVILLLDADQDISDQDAHIADFIVESGRALVVAVNKWDKMDSYQKEQAKITIERKFQFLSFAKFNYISAHKNYGISQVLEAADDAYTAAISDLSTPKLTRVLHDAIEQQAPKRSGFSRPKPRYAHQGGKNPPVIIVHGNGLDGITDSYTRFLERKFRETFNLMGTPVRIQYKNGKNPYLTAKMRLKSKRK
jgi:GTPase